MYLYAPAFGAPLGGEGLESCKDGESSCWYEVGSGTYGRFGGDYLDVCGPPGGQVGAWHAQRPRNEALELVSTMVRS